jgi:hypothetical protein
MSAQAGRIALIALVVLIAACSSAPAAVPSTAIATDPPSAATAIPPPPAGPPIKVTGDKKTGVSPKFKLAGGSYRVDWKVAAAKGGCFFSTYLAKKANGPTIEAATASLFSGGTQTGSTDWSDVPSGTYVFQEDRSGLLNCTGAWSATLTPE